MNILIEDNPGDTLIFRRFWEKVSSEPILNFSSLVEASDLSAEKVFLDLGVEGSWGLSTIFSARKSWPDAFITVVTGVCGKLIEEKDVQAFRDAGADHVILKEDLSTEKIRQALIKGVENEVS